MAKNKGKFGKGKPVEEAADEFVSGVSSVVDKLKPLSKQLAIGTGVTLFCITAGVLYMTHQENQSAEASGLFHEALAVYAQPVLSAEDRELFASLKDSNIPMPEVSHDTAQVRAEAALDPLDRLRTEYAESDAAAAARLFHASALYDAKRYIEAATLYEQVAASGPQTLRGAAREGYGYALEADALAKEDAAARDAGLEQALTAFEAVQPDADGPRRDYAMYHQARLLQSLGRTEDAVKRFNELLEQQPSTSLRTDVRNRLVMLEAPAK